MKYTNLTKPQTAVAGYLVSDAAGMGIHWIYSQGKLSSIAKNHGGELEFLEPDQQNYQGVPAFFAHPLRKAGEGSNYSEYVRILFRALNESGFSPGDYIRAFGEHFGVGGTYVGYADSPMRETIYNMAHRAKELSTTIQNMKTSLPLDKQASAAHYISRYFFEFDGNELKQTVRAPLKLQEFSQDELQEVDRIIDGVMSLSSPLGPEDDQMPALSRATVLPALYSDSELDAIGEQAIRITNNHALAVAYGLFFHRIMADLYSLSPSDTGKNSFIRSIQKHKDLLPEKSRNLVQEALDSQELDYRGMTKHFGAACHVDMAVPLSIHILLHTTSFTEAVRVNNRASGDNCGRAVFLGPIAGVLYGVGGENGIPLEWMEKTVLLEEITQNPGWKKLGTMS